MDCSHHSVESSNAVGAVEDTRHGVQGGSKEIYSIGENISGAIGLQSDVLILSRDNKQVAIVRVDARSTRDCGRIIGLNVDDPLYTHRSSNTPAQNGMANKDQRILHNTFILRAHHLIHFEVSIGAVN